MSEIKSIAPWEVQQYWTRISRLLTPVMLRPEVDNTIEDVKQFLLAGNMQAWHIGWETVLVTQIIPFGANPQAPTKRVCVIVYGAGKDVKEWAADARAHFKDWARSMNCQCVRINGRRGWGEIFPETREAYTVFEEDIL